MEDSRALARAAALERGQDLGPALAVVEQRGQAEAGGAVEHPFEDLDLLRPRRVVVVEIEADLPDRDDAGAAGERLEPGAVPRGLEVFRLVGMDADGGEDPGRRVRERGRILGIGERRARHQKPRHSGGAGATQQCRAARRPSANGSDYPPAPARSTLDPRLSTFPT